ncbi:integral peroxisomal membrane peroxin-domain-containing protein [Obelidium mucronatum]|nr:integral peroxisomal membrane peroxin-domain-containing protein [Obelidium mucronatum]
MDNFNQMEFFGLQERRRKADLGKSIIMSSTASSRPATPTQTSCSASICSDKTSSISKASSIGGKQTPMPAARTRTARLSNPSLPMHAFPIALSGLPAKDIPELVSRQTAHVQAKLQKRKSESEGIVAGTSSLVSMGAGGLARLSVIVDGVELVGNILKWKDAALSSIILVTFIACCVYPFLLVVLPQLVLSLYVFYRYISKAPPLVPSLPPQSDLITVFENLGTERYNRNLAFVQNAMALFCSTFDTLAAFHDAYLTWKSPEKTAFVVKTVIAAIPLALLLFHVVPFWLIRFISGVCGTWILCRETWICMLFMNVLPKVLYRRGVMVGESVVRGLPLPDSVVDFSVGQYAWGVGDCASSNEAKAEVDENLEEQQGSIAKVTVELFENQRWWAGPGWTATMLGEERASWSDGPGTTKLIEKSAGSAPLQGYEWDDDDWILDFDWTATDSDGWVYSDHNWTNPSKSAGITSLTRRRRWIRLMKEAPIPKLRGASNTVDGGRKMNSVTSWSSWTRSSKAQLDERDGNVKRLSSWLVRDSVAANSDGLIQRDGVRKRGVAQ